jgi:hypothetical protein
MDSQDRNEAKIRRREEALARRVGEALDRMNPAGVGNCPDADIVAAYMEQALGPDESSQWEGHFANCTRCRKILRVLAASADTPLAAKEVAQLGELVSTVRAPIEITGETVRRARPSRADWRMRWLAPALGVAAALAVWFAMRPPWRATDRGASSSLIAQAPKEELPLNPAAAESDRLSRVAPQQDEKALPAPPIDRLSTNGRSLNAPVEAPSRERADTGNALDKVSPSMGDATGSLQEKKKLDALQEGREIQPAARAVPPPPPPKPAQAQSALEAPAAPQSEAKAALGAAPTAGPQVESNSNASAPAPSPSAQAVTVQGAAGATPGGAPVQKASPELRASARKEQTFEVFRSTQKYSSLLKAPSGSILWRAGIGGLIEHSTDTGKTWATQISPSQEDWLAGAAVSETVCWLVGRNGAIARTTDGEHWLSVAPPAQAAGADAKLPDWAGLTANDGQSATITASDGRHFATRDGGKSWQALP